MNNNLWKQMTAAETAIVQQPTPFVLRAGLTPTWATWREGRFAERKEVFASLWKCFINWREALAKEEPPPCKRLQVFWIQGQPGDGKSVLLLQLMATCLREELASPIGWLEHSPDGRAFQNAPPPGSNWVFCAEIPTRIEGSLRDDWMARLQEAGAKALVTSGSSEIRHGFDFRYQRSIKVTKFAVPSFSLSEAVHFAEWFQGRTGTFREAAALWREGMSLTEFLFALHHGRPLADLTSDVRGALGNLGLGRHVRSVWLVNALGLRAPSSLLATETARTHAVKISERGTVPVEFDAAGLRLATPGIAWPLIGTWLGEQNRAQQLSDALAFVLKRWLDAGDEENALRFLRQLRDTEWLIDEKPVGHGNSFMQLKRKDILRELYRVHRRDFGGHPALAAIPAWLEINEAFDLMLLPDPVVCATEVFAKPENESRRAPSLAAMTWLAADRRRPPAGVNARNAVADYFLSPASEPGTGYALMRLVRNTKKLSEARAIAEPWLRLFPDHPEALAVLGALVKRADNSEEFLAWAAERFIRADASRSGTAKLLATIVEAKPHDETTRNRALRWASAHLIEPETGILWLTFLADKAATGGVLRATFKWLAANPAQPESDAIRSRLLRDYAQVPGVARVMEEWLRTHSNDEQTPELLLKLLKSQDCGQKAKMSILDWVDRSLAHPASPKLLRLLLKDRILDIQAVAERWFEANPKAACYAEMLAAFIHRLRGVEKWTARGEAYVQNPRHPGREHVLAALLAANRCELRHVQLALGLLQRLPVEPRIFLEATLGSALVWNLPQAQLVFRQFAGTPEIHDLTRAVSRAAREMADVRAESTRCLLPVIDEEAASLILDHLVRAEVRSSEIISVVLEWLRKHHSDPGYTRLLRALYKHPAVWECLLATRRLDKRVIADFRDYAMHHD